MSDLLCLAAIEVNSQYIPQHRSEVIHKCVLFVYALHHIENAVHGGHVEETGNTILHCRLYCINSYAGRVVWL